MVSKHKFIIVSGGERQVNNNFFFNSKKDSGYSKDRNDYFYHKVRSEEASLKESLEDFKLQNDIVRWILSVPYFNGQKKVGMNRCKVRSGKTRQEMIAIIQIKEYEGLT